MRTSFPNDREELALLLDLYLLDKAVYELGYELNNRPSWVQDSVRWHLAAAATSNRQLAIGD